ncbi:MAG: TlpA family protein disulfide reductase [Vicinamibacterales bacterium]|nr:TlpA family protein disulfide reductase [Vicinamibacterales bacterium]
MPFARRLRPLAAVALMLVGTVAAPLHAQAPAPNPIPEVRALIAKSDIPGAERVLRAFLAEHGPTPQGLEALSWLGRGSLAAGELDEALNYAYETERMAVAALASRPLDEEPHLPIALGAAIEVQAQTLARQEQLSTAIRVLERAVDGYGATSIRTRLFKNINLLSLEGKSAPEYLTAEYVGRRPPSLRELKGKAVLLFFWAHWCPDCKAMAPTLTALQEAYGDAGLVVVAPTQRYGYVAGRAPAEADVEMRYIAQVLAESYPGLDVPVPVSAESFSNFGSSTTPTLVLVDRTGVVTLYNPGRMTREALEPHVKRALR